MYKAFEVGDVVWIADAERDVAGRLAKDCYTPFEEQAGPALFYAEREYKHYCHDDGSDVEDPAPVEFVRQVTRSAL